MKNVLTLFLFLLCAQSFARSTPYPSYKCTSDLSLLKDGARVHDKQAVDAGFTPNNEALGEVNIHHELDGKSYDLYVLIDSFVGESGQVGESVMLYSTEHAKSTIFESIDQKLPDVFAVLLPLTTDESEVVDYLKCEIK